MADFYLITVLIRQATNSKEITRTVGCSTKLKTGVMSRVFMLFVLMSTSVGLYAEVIRYQFDIPAGEAGVTLNLLAQQSKTPLLFPYDEVRHITTNPVSGDFTLDEAVSLLLMDTGLQGMVDERGVLIVSNGASGTDSIKRTEQMAENKRKSWFSRVLTLFAGAAAVTAVAAQTADSGNSNAGSGATASELVLEEIVLTAQKREQTLKDIPAAVTAIPAADFDAILRGGVSIKALAARAPSLNVNGNSGRFLPQFYIRGLGNTDFDVNASQPVSLVLDEVSIESTTLRSIPVFDVAQVEILNGPQGTLFGRNTNAGIVKIDSVKPAYEREGFLRASYGSRNGRSVNFAVGGGLSDKVAARLSVHYSGQDDFITNTVKGQDDNLGGYDQYAGRLQLLFEPTGSTTALLRLQGSKIDSNTPVFYANALTPGVEGTRPGFDEEIVTQDADNGQELEHFGVSLKIDHDFENFTLTSVTSYDTLDSFSKADVDGGIQGGPEAIGTLGQQAFFSVATGDGIDEHYQVSQELRVALDREKWFLQFGGYFFQEDFRVRTEDFIFNTTSFTEQKTTSFAAFGQLEYWLTDDFSVTGGVRYTDDDKRLETIDVLFPATIKADDGYISWDVAANYDFNENVTGFARVAQGSRGPVTLGRFGFTSTADTETLTSYEVGLKTTLFGGRARWNINGYLYDIDDQQITAVGQTDNTNRLLNIDSTRGYGFETDIEFAITSTLHLRSNLSYNNTEIRDETLSESRCGSTPSCTALDPVRSVDPGPFGPVSNVFVDGNPLPLAPEWIFNVILDYTAPIETGELYFNTDWNYKSEANIFLYESVEFVSESRWLGGVRVGYRHQKTGLDVAFVGRNITNEVTVFNGLAFLNLAATVTDPSYFGAEVSLDF